jgi:hypothetical protein
MERLAALGSSLFRSAETHEEVEKTSHSLAGGRVQSVPSTNSSSKSSPSMSSTWSSRPHSVASRPSSGSSVNLR